MLKNNSEKLEKLTKKQEKLLDVISQEYINNAHSGNTEINKELAIKSLLEIYKFSDLQSPEFKFVSGPLEAIYFCKNTLKQDVKTIDYFGVGYDSGWVSFYDYFQHIGVLEKEDTEFNTVKDFIYSGVWATIMFDTLVICIARPKLVAVDEKGNLHSDNGPAIAFDDGYKEYAWHGTWVTEQLIMNPDTITAEQINNEKNSEISRAIAERLGWEKYTQKIETILIHKWFDETTKCHYELYDFKHRKGSLQPRLLKMESPELNDNTQPYYIEPVPPQAISCQSAKRWQCDPSNPTIEECNKNSVLSFEIEA